MPFWDKLFLKEGFATLYQFVIPAKIYPEKYFKHGLRTKACVRAAAIDITTSNSMTTYVETEAEIRAKFDAISYSKAGCFYGMIMNAITEETWFKAMHYYLTTNALQTSDIDDVHKAIQKAIDEDFGTSRFDIAPIMKSWENQPGFPIVKVEKINGKVRLTQERFWTKSGHIYSIPINHATKSSPDFTETKATLWMHNETFEFHPNDMALNDWIIINIQQTGYYRANYAVDIWNSITEELLTNHTMIHWINRQQLFIDMEYALTSGCVSPINSFDHLKYLKNEDVADVWTQGGILINDIRGKFYDTEVDDSFRQYVDSLYKNHFERIGFEASENETELRNSLIDISCRNHYEPCLNFTRNKLLNEYQTNEKFVDFCHGVRILNEDEADEIFNFMVTVNSTIRRTAAMNGLTCSHNRSFLRKFLSSMLNADYKFYTSAIRSANIRRMMSESIYGLDEVMSFLIENKNIFNNRDYL